MSEISVIIPVYKVEKFLRRCLDSVLAQTFTDFEALCVNDGSPDSCPQILAEYAEKDNRIKIINQQNQGLSMARNNALDIATGKYVYFVDSDDAVHPQLLEICYQIAEAEAVDLVCFTYQKNGEVGLPSFPTYPLTDIERKITDNPLQFRQTRGDWRIPVNVWTKFYRADILKGIRFIPGIMFEDYPHTYRVLARHPKTAMIKTPLYFYTKNTNSISYQKVSVPMIESYHQGLLDIVTTYQNAPRAEQNRVRKIIFPTIFKRQLKLWQKCSDPHLKKQIGEAFAFELADMKNRGWLSPWGNRLDRYLCYRWMILKMCHKIIRISGGAGNQMFQYAFGLSLGKHVLIDRSFYRKNKERVFILDQWLLPYTAYVNLPKKKWMRRLLQRLSLLPPLKKETVQNVFESALQQCERGYFDGYFQAPRYFEGIRDRLLKIFVPKTAPNSACQAVLDHMRQVNAVAVHIRRGDYLKFSDVYILCSLSYYRKAMEHIATHTPQPHFFIFSDDLNWVKENLKTDYPCTYVEKQWDSDIYDIWLMKHCHHNIIANSSFSWWGAWLNEHPDKIVIAPTPWTVDRRPMEIIPPDWLQLNSQDQ